MKKFHLTKNYAIINFDATLCDSEVNIISSKSFESVLIQYVRKLRLENSPIIEKLKSIRVHLIYDAYQLLLIWKYEDVMYKNPYLNQLLKERDAFYHFTESFYDYLRKMEYSMWTLGYDS